MFGYAGLISLIMLFIFSTSCLICGVVLAAGYVFNKLRKDRKK